MKEVFSQVVLLLVESGHIDLQTIYVDGTKIEANANKFSFVWGKAIQKNIQRKKDDYMKNGQFKPGYNLQFSTQNQFIINYSNHDNPTDTKMLILHLKQILEMYPGRIENICADSGYGSEESYNFLEANNLTPFVKYNYFHKEQKKGDKAYSDFHPNNLYYNANTDVYYCPMGQSMKQQYVKTEKSDTGYQKKIHVYQAVNYKGCPLKGSCHKSQGNRIIQVNHKLNKLRNKARELLISEQGLKHRSQRPVDVEAVFGNLKQNKGFKRSLLRDHEKIEVETGLLSLAINLKKMNAIKVA